MNIQSSLAEQLRSKEYRDEFVAAQIRIGLPLQCRALRESRNWTQPQLAEAAGMSQPRISEIERPGERKLNLETLLRLASAFDVALQVRFVPFSKLVDDDDNLNLDEFHIAAFDEDIANLAKLEDQMDKVIVMGAAHRAAMGNGQTRNLQAEFAEIHNARSADDSRANSDSKPHALKTSEDEREGEDVANIISIAC